MVMGWITWFVLMTIGWVTLFASWNATGDNKMMLNLMACVAFLAAIIIGRLNSLEEAIKEKIDGNKQ